MKIPYLKSLAVVACLVAFAPARATSEHDYKKNEYLIIRHGLAPGRQLSVASHGAGENNNDAFHVWLMAEPAHRKIATLDNISADNNLDTDPDAYHAFWSQDSRQVGVAFRSSRHEVTLNLYRVENRRAHLLTGPSLFNEVNHRDVGEDDDMRTLNAMVEWRGGNRFVLKEFRSFVAEDDRLARLFGAYGRVAEKLPDGKFFIQFFADAECEVVPGDKYRIVRMQPGNPDDVDTWWEK
jgi:hypothetical protein